MRRPFWAFCRRRDDTLAWLMTRPREGCKSPERVFGPEDSIDRVWMCLNFVVATATPRVRRQAPPVTLGPCRSIDVHVSPFFSFFFCVFLPSRSSPRAQVCLIYVERLMESAHVPLLASTWKPILLCGLLLASKVMNSFFLSLSPEIK